MAISKTSHTHASTTRQTPRFAALADALTQQGYEPGVPPTVPSDAAAIDQRLVEGHFCTHCHAQTIEYRPYRRHGATSSRGRGIRRREHWHYRAFGVCATCGGWFEF